MRMLIVKGWICLLAVAAAGCRPTAVAESETSMHHFGQFEGDVVAVWDADGRNMTLREDFAYVDPRGNRWLAPVGSVVNGASIPRLFWTVIGGPFEGKYRNASVVHDVGCAEMHQSWEDVHRMFYEACRCGGVEEMQAKVMYYAVYHFGPRWQRVVEKVIEQVTDASGQGVEQEVTVQRLVRIDPPPPTPEELDQVMSYIVEDDPELIAIERFQRESLRQRPRRGNRDAASRADANRLPQGDTRTAKRGHKRPDGVPSIPAAMTDDRGQEALEGRSTESRSETRMPPLGQEERKWAQEIAMRHVEEQTGESRPAEYRVRRSRGGYRVDVQFLHPDDEGRMVPYAGGTSSMRIARDGQVMEVLSGLESTDVSDRH